MGTRRRAKDPAKNARVLLIEPEPTELDRLSALLRAAHFRVVALDNPDALWPLARLFKPEIGVVGLGVGTSEVNLEALRLGRRLARRSRGTVPVFYLSDTVGPVVLESILEAGAGTDVLSRGAPEELVCRIRGLLRFKAAVAEAERAAIAAKSPMLHDEVTGLYNRRFLLELVGAETRRAERYGGHFAVVIAELDDFSDVHARFGGDVSDRLTLHAAMVLKQSLRDADVLARVGRFHFGMLMSGMAAEDLPAALDRVRRRFAQARFDLEGVAVRASLTFGAATFPDVVGPAQQIFARAIQALDRGREEQRHAALQRAAIDGGVGGCWVAEE
ncbi:MAG: diguanylate cyclase [Myxococcaceae bacterium]|nr:diguanylate cyclase [Myxococcaceae bacterium]